MIYKVEGGFVISSNHVWRPGCYDSERAAKYAFRFKDEELRALQEKANSSTPDYDKRVITFEMLRAARRAPGGGA